MKIKIAGIICLFFIVGAWVYVHAQTTAQAAPPTGATQAGLPTGAYCRHQVVAADIDYKAWGESLSTKKLSGSTRKRDGRGS
jgi:hypothetical protein